MAVSALILDLGNVLVKHDNARLFRTLAQRVGKPVEELHTRLDAALWERVNRGQLPGDSLRVELCERLGVSDVTADEFFDLWNSHFTVDDEMVNEVSGMVGQRKLVLLSNTHDLHVQWIRARVPVLSRFDALVLSCEVGLVKPEPEIYRRALAATGIPAAESVFFDDVERYVEGAREVGLRARVFTTVEQFRRDLSEL
jgi:putative hydrolase of the HAD superfamily